VEACHGSRGDDSTSKPSPMTLYVDSGAPGENTGSTWDDAFTDLGTALARSISGDEVWVAAGIYTPGDDRSDAFSLINGVELYGGFAGGETDRWDRDPSGNETVLSGEIGTEDAADNCYHVFYHPDGSALDDSAVLDGFVITGGYADGAAPHDDGGGMYNDGASPTIARCIFRDNSAEGSGGAMANLADAAPVLSGCLFTGNTAGADGGGVFNSGASPAITNCTFSANTADRGGALADVSESFPVITSSILSGDEASSQGDEIYNDDDSAALVTCSSIDGSGGSGDLWDDGLGTDGDGNIDADPLFVAAPTDDSAGDFHLTADSPCIDAGDIDAPDGLDLDGGARLIDGDGDGAVVVDMGADEFDETPADSGDDEVVDDDAGEEDTGGDDTGGDDASQSEDTDSAAADGGSGGGGGGCFITSVLF
jgi:hypothetical protein